MLVSLLGYFFCMVTTLTAFVAILIGFFDNNSSLDKGHYSHPAFVHTVTAGDRAAWHSSPAKEEFPAPATTAVKEHTPHKPKTLARQRNNYDDRGNALGYAEDTRNGPQRLLSIW